MALTSTKPRRATPNSRTAVCEPVPAYGLTDGVLSFRHGLRSRDRSTLEKALEIVGRGLREREVFATPDAVKNYLRLQLAGEGREIFSVLYLDSQNRAIAFENHFAGTLTQTSVYPREIVLAALRHGAASVIFSHNHPSGVCTPSRADEALTQTLKAALSLVDVRVLDHVIVGGNNAFSMAERGLI